MEKEIEKIMAILVGKDEPTKKKLLLECAVRLGSKEWEEAVRDLWKRMEELDKKK
jgi:hypothetical protein